MSSNSEKKLSDELRELGREGHLGKHSVLSPTLFPYLADRAAAVEAELKLQEERANAGWDSVRTWQKGHHELTGKLRAAEAERDMLQANVQRSLKVVLDRYLYWQNAAAIAAPDPERFDAVCFEDWRIYELLCQEFGIKPNPSLFRRSRENTQPGAPE